MFGTLLNCLKFVNNSSVNGYIRLSVIQMAMSNDTRLDSLSKILVKRTTMTTKRLFHQSLRLTPLELAYYNLKLHQIDVKTIFLNRNLEEDVYIAQLEGLSTKKKHLMRKLKKSIYELKQACRQWYLKFNDAIIALRFKENIV